jgi:repressor LexA
VVIVDKSKTVKHGDIVIAQIDGSYTIKYFYKNSDKQIYLQAADEGNTVIFPEEDLIIF